MYILRNCKLIPELTEGTELTQADLVIRGERITGIVPRGACPEGDYEEMDMEGMTVMPGLIDMHVHLFMGKIYTGDPGPTPCGRAFDCLKYARFLLDAGITTVRDVGDDENYPAVALRNAIEAGDITGPRIKCSGLTMIPPERGIDSALHMCGIFSGPQDMRRRVRDNFMKGADFVKIYGTGSMISPGSTPGRRILEEDEILEAVTIAGRKGSYCACHWHGAGAIDVMRECGVRTIEHASLITEETLKKMNGRRDVGIVPTVAVTSEEVLAADGEAGEVLERFETVREQMYECLGRAGEYDVLIGWGTDMSLAAYQKYPYAEFKTRKDRLGYENIEILKQATINSAKLMMMEDQIGSVSVGKYADLIAVEGDPAEDLSVMYRKPRHVFKGGVKLR